TTALILNQPHSNYQCNSSLLPSSSRLRPLHLLCLTLTSSSASADAPGSLTILDALLTGSTVAPTVLVPLASAASLLRALNCAILISRLHLVFVCGCTISIAVH
ncbi:hypothetical protein CYLTODRAFT_492850, partial [Cylindrobasidium torrendii FP15055 ss-10]